MTSPEGVEYTMNKREDRYAINGTYSWYTTQITVRGNAVTVRVADVAFAEQRPRYVVLAAAKVGGILAIDLTP